RTPERNRAACTIAWTAPRGMMSTGACTCSGAGPWRRHSPSRSTPPLPEKNNMKRSAAISPAVLITLLVLASAVMIGVERIVIRTGLKLSFRGDVEREMRWVAQYGQGVCTLTAALLVWRLDPRRFRAAAMVLIAVIGASLLSTGIKHLSGRVRPGYPSAGQF